MTTIAGIIVTLQNHPGKHMTGEEIYDVMSEEADKQSLYATLSQYSRPPHNLLMREKPTGEAHYRYWLEAGKKLPQNIEDMLLRREAERAKVRQRMEDTTVERRINGAEKPQMNQPVQPIARTNFEADNLTDRVGNAGATVPEPATAGPQNSVTYHVPVVGIDPAAPGTERAHGMLRVPQVEQPEAFKAVIVALEERERVLKEEHAELDAQIEELVGLQGAVSLEISNARSARQSLRLILGESSRDEGPKT